MARKQAKSHLFEVVIDVVNPALVMGAVGSLVFFLIDIGYSGQYDGRLRWTFFFFVFGAVLASRISLLMGSERGLLYGLILGGVTFVATARFVDGIGSFINMAIILVIAASTYVLVCDTSLLESQGSAAGAGVLAEVSQIANEQPTKARRGAWVVVFTLAAWVVFGLGQSLISPNDAARRASAMYCMAVSTGCAMALLLTTALLRLRAYLRSRRLNMPAAITIRWLVCGIGIVAISLAIAFVMPRPYPETAFIRFSTLGSAPRDASKMAMDSKTGGEGDGGNRAENNHSSDAKQGEGKGTPDKKSKGRSESGKKGSGGKTKADSEKGGDEKGESGDVQPPPTAPWSDSLVGVLQKIAQVIVAIILLLAILFLLVRGLSASQAWARKILESIASWWYRLFGKADVDSELESPVEMPRRSFSEFADPFADGTATARTDEELVRYTFSAMEAWARASNIERRADETPLEFTARIGAIEAGLRKPLQNLGSIYALLAYTPRGCPPGSRDAMQQIWSSFVEPRQSPNR